MHSFLLDDKIDYDGSQLRSHWVCEQTGQTGDAIVSFCGAASVTEEHMVDLDDLKAKDWIASSSMVHFIAEHFNADLMHVILLQRLFVARLADQIRAYQPHAQIVREGNDLYDLSDGRHKLSVSIATTSPVSSLLHLAVNISSKGTPVPTKGLEDYGIDPISFATENLKTYTAEWQEVQYSRGKVRSVQ